MVVGTTVFKLDGNSYLSPEFHRGGLAGTFAIDVTNVANTPNFTVKVQHRNSEDTSFTTAGTFSTITATGKTTLDVSGLKEIVRFEYSFDVGDGSDAAVHFLMQPPSWRPY